MVRNHLGRDTRPGGEHVLMGTHNRLLSLATPDFPLAYLEIIAINPAAELPAASVAQGRKRWFDLDNPALQARLAKSGPELVHWVARSTALQTHLEAFNAAGLQPGTPVAASRPTPQGLLQWQMVLRPDGALLHGGAVPTLIQWQGPHPVQTMPASGLQLQGLQLGGPLPAGLRPWLRLPGLSFSEEAGSPALVARLQTPLGLKPLQSQAA